MHQQAKNFLHYVKATFPQYMRNTRVLDVGSGDINGNNRDLFTDCDYIGCDVYAAPNVDLVCRAADLPFVDGYFDVIVSSECFEHDPQTPETFRKIVRLLRPGGLFFFTCATTGRPEHGTRRTSPDQSWGTIGGVGDFVDHYANVTLEDLDAAICIGDAFPRYAAYVNDHTCDLYFWGIKADRRPFTDDGARRIA